MRKKKIFYKAIKAARIIKGISITEASAVAGKTPLQLYRMEEGDLSMPRAVGRKLCDFYGIKPELREQIVYGVVFANGRIYRA